MPRTIDDFGNPIPLTKEEEEEIEKEQSEKIKYFEEHPDEIPDL